MVRQRCPNSRRESVAAVGSSGRVRTRTSLKKVFDRKLKWDWMIWVLVWVVVLFLLGAFVQVVHLPRGAKRWWWRLSSLNLIPYHSKDRNGVPAAAWMPRRNTNLEIRLGKLIQQAKADAASKGIFTEMRASFLRTEQQKQKMRTYEADMAILRDAVNGMKRKVILCYTNADCGRGACVGSKCVCAVGYVGTQCTRPIHLIIEKEEQDIETQRRIILPLGGTDYFTDRMFGEEQELFAQCNVFFSRKEEEGYHSTGKDSDIESFVLYPNPEHEKAKASHEEDEQEDKDSILHAYVEHVFGSVGATEENMHALETLFTSLRECLSVHMYPGSHDTLLHKYVLQNLEQAIPRGFVVHE